VSRDCRSGLRCRGHFRHSIALSPLTTHLRPTDRRPCPLRRLVAGPPHLGALKRSACRAFEYKCQVKSCRQCHQSLHIPSENYLPTSQLRYDVLFYPPTSDLPACSLSHFVTSRRCARLAHPARSHEHWRQMARIWHGLHG
jgi:hypothetical protein